MTDLLTSLTSLAVSAFREQKRPLDPATELFELMWVSDPMLEDAPKARLRSAFAHLLAQTLAMRDKE